MFYCWVIKEEVILSTEGDRITDNRDFWCRCALGKHPFPSRTRRLRPGRPMVLHWRRCGRAGGRQIKKKNKRRACSYRNRHRQVSSVGNRTVKGEDRWPVLTRSAGKCCYDSWFYQWLEILNKKYLRFLMTDKISVSNKECTLKTAYMKVWWKSNILDRKRLKRKIGRHRLKSVRADEDQQWESKRPHHLR